MKKIRAAVVGYGNIGKFTIEALEASADFEIAGVVRRNGAENKPAELAPYEVELSVIARGISVGGELEYTDEVTLGRSILNRTPFEGK